MKAPQENKETEDCPLQPKTGEKSKGHISCRK